MKLLESRVTWGILLILGGVLFLLQNLGVFPFGNLFWAILWALAGVYFLLHYASNRAHWWAVIPGVILLTLALSNTLGLFNKGLENAWGGSLVLGGIALSFVAVYIVYRPAWWAIIPAGVLATLAVVSGMENAGANWASGGVFFLGLGMTFGLIGILPPPETDEPFSLRWAFIPAVALLIIGVLMMAAAGQLVNYFWPVFLIAIGLFMLYRALIYRRS